MAEKDTKPVYIDKELHKDVKIEASKRGMSIRELVESFLKSVGLGRDSGTKQE